MIAKDYWNKPYGQVGDIKRIQICETKHGRKRFDLALGAVIHECIGGNRPALQQSFELSSTQSSMERFPNTELTGMHLIYRLAEGNA
ncbi:hypothetical protein TNCV_3213161 [Trichonephila clavipes]|nr:hypothetical protein TNCV_3213161 [Trichonephila clavipes]